MRSAKITRYIKPTQHFMINKPQLPESYKVVPAANGFNWVKDAAELLRGNFVRWLVLFLLYFILFLASNIHVIASLTFLLLNPVMWAGIFLAGASTVAKLEWTLGILFEPLKKNGQTLIRLGLLITAVNYLIVLALFSHLSTIIDMEALEKVRLAMNETQDMTPFFEFFSDPVQVKDIMLAFLIALLVALPITMAGWFAPVLIMEKNLSVVQALKTSFQACSSNFLAFLIYGIIGFILLMFVVMTVYIGVIFVGPLFIASYYCSYEDIFPSDKLESEDENESNSTFVV